MVKVSSTQRSSPAKEAAPRAHLVHQSARRMRLRIPSRRHDVAFFGHLQQQLAAIPKIESTLVTPKTASVLLSFAEGDGNGIAAALDALGLVSLVEANASEPGTDSDGSPDQRIVAAPRGPAAGPTAPANRRVDRRALAFTVFILLLLRQLLKGGWLAPGLAFIWLLLELLRAQLPQHDSPLAGQGSDASAEATSRR